MRSQRYRLTHEFLLKDRGDYALMRALLDEAIQKVHAGFGNNRSNPDYLAIEKCDYTQEETSERSQRTL